MASPSVPPTVAKKLVDSLQTDLRTLSTDCRRKYPPVKEASEAGLLKLRQITIKSHDLIAGLLANSTEVIQPFVLGCDTKNPKIVQLCLTSIQKLTQYKAVSQAAAQQVVNALWVLMEAGIEDLKLLQTTLLLVTTSNVVQHEALAKILVLSLRLHFTKDNTIINTAAATVRQLVSSVFERVTVEDLTPVPDNLEPMSMESLKVGGRQAPKSLRPCAADAYLLFQDLCQLVNAHQPYWLTGMTEMTRTFCLELMESVLTDYPAVFLNHPEFSFILKETVCTVIIKLFSPSVKHRPGVVPPAPGGGAGSVEKPYFPIVMRLLRIVSVLIQHYYILLVTECEIFLSLLVKFLDPERPPWQRILVLEVLTRLCSHPTLVRNFCKCYDMKPHSTKVFRDIVNGLGAFIQSQFVNSAAHAQTTPANLTKAPDTQGSPPSLVGGLPVGGGITPQSAFFYRNVWIPLVVNIAGPLGSQKPIFLEMSEKIEPPTVADGYALSLAFLCLLDVVHCVNALNEGQDTSGRGTVVAKETKTAPTVTPLKEATPETPSAVRALREELINSSWCGILAALSLLLDASCDESATEAILKSVQVYTSLCGELGLSTPRDAFITALCKASLPPHYALTILNSHSATQRVLSSTHTRSSSQEGMVTGQTEVIHGSQVVAVGTPLPTASLPLGAQQGPVMLTAKNIQCMRALLSLAHCHGGMLGSAWHQVLTTLQHLVWILGLKPSSGGGLKAMPQMSDNALITTAVMADLPILSAMLSRLFESSQYLDDVALHHLIDALCKLSSEAMDLAYSNQEPSLVAVAKLLETGLVNLSRVDVLWKPITGHLLEVCQHPHSEMRGFAAGALTMMVKAALTHKYDPPLRQQPRLQAMLLLPLQELSGIIHPDIRQKQLECILQILHSNGDTLNQGWPLVLAVIGAISNEQGENLIRLAFQSLQLVVTDFLPTMPCSCLQVCVDVAGRFGLQTRELNISLTAIGLLWNISDYFCQNHERIVRELAGEPGGGREGELTLPPYDALWMSVFLRLGELCVDQRPAVRKSAGQTLFSTITTHGALLQPHTWQTVLWKVLFPLLDSVKKLSAIASGRRDDANEENILMHHSRDTAQKQWAETQVLTLAGVARVFYSHRAELQHLGDFPRAWVLLLEYIEVAALCKNGEVSLAALKSFQEILHPNGVTTPDTPHGDPTKGPLPKLDPAPRMGGDHSTSKDPGKVAKICPGDPDEEAALWSTAWRVWLSIGTAATTPPSPTEDKSHLYIPSQAFLTSLVMIFPALYQHIKHRFVVADLLKLSSVLQRALTVPVHSDSSPFIIPIGEVTLTALQSAILAAIKVLHKEVMLGSDNIQVMYPEVFHQLLTYVEYTVKPPKFGKVEAKSVTAMKGTQADWVAMNYVPFAEAIVGMVTELYRATARHPSVIHGHVLQNIVKTFRVPLRVKYGCPSQTTWVLVINALLSNLSVGLPIARKHEAAFKGMWMELGELMEDFLFSQSPAPANQSNDQCQRDEAIDCELIQLIRDDILPYAKHVPQEFIVKVMHILNRGSIHSHTMTAFIDTESSRKLREEFAKSCFETLLQFSFIMQQQTGGSTEGEGAITKLAVTALLQRCRDVMTKFVADERLSGKCPLPRPRMSEMSFVLKAASTLLITLKRAPPANVDQKIWEHVIGLYPVLVDCITSSSPQVCPSLKEVLHEYRELLSPPAGHATNGT